MSNHEDDDLINPETDSDSMLVRSSCREGKKVFRAVGGERGETASGVSFANYRLVCLKDLEKPYKGENPETDVGLWCRLKFHNSARAKGRLVNFAKTVGHTKPFRFMPYDEKDESGNVILGKDGHPTEKDDLNDLVYGKLFVGRVKVDFSDDGNREFPEVVEWRPYSGAIDPQFDDIWNKGCDDYDEYIARKAEREERQRSAGGRGGRGRGRSGDSDEKYGF